MTKIWRNWLIKYIILMLVAGITYYYFGLDVVFIAMFGLLIATLFYQKIVNKRSWHAILWGDRENL